MIEKNRHLLPGVPFALASAILFGASAPLSKILVGAVDPWILAGILYLGAGSGLAILSAIRRLAGLRNEEAPLQRSDIPWLALVILFGGMLGPLLLMLGLVRTSASSGSLLLNLEGLATMGIAWLVFRENVDRRLLLGAAAILAGAALLSWNGGGFQFDAGGMLIAAACLCWGIDNNLTRKLSSADPVQTATIKGLFAGTTNLVLAIGFGASLPDHTLILAGGLVGFFCVGLSLVLFMLGLRHLGTARTGAYFSLAPFIGTVLAVTVLNEDMTIQLVGAGVLMGFGLWLHLAERHDHDHTHEALEHDHAHVHDEHHQHDHEGPIAGAHSHWHRHEPLSHKHAHYPDLHHRHSHN